MTKNLNKVFWTHLKDSYKSITCLNGKLPDLDFFKTDLPIIAVDGALNTLMENNIVPHIVVGDLDSVDKQYLEKVESLQITDQNTSDFEKALSYLASNDLLPTIVLGMNGGYLDHIFNNINLVIQHNILFYDPPIMGMVIKNTTFFNLPYNTKISLFGNAKVSTRGLKWNLENATLAFPGINSCFNRSIDESVMIDIHEGFILVFIYLKDIEDFGSF